MSEYATYTRFYAPEEAEFLITLLQQNNIPYKLEHEVNQIDKIYVGENVEAMFALRIPGNRFNDTHAVLAAQAVKDMLQPEFDHQFTTYTTAELKEVLQQPEGWSAYDLQIARSLLTERPDAGEPIAINDKVSYMPARVERIWIVLGYLVCLLALTDFFYMVIAGFFAGLAITQAKRTLSNGDTVKTYIKQDIYHGRAMMVLSIIGLIGGFFLFLYRNR